MPSRQETQVLLRFSSLSHKMGATDLWRTLIIFNAANHHHLVDSQAVLAAQKASPYTSDTDNVLRPMGPSETPTWGNVSKLRVYKS